MEIGRAWAVIGISLLIVWPIIVFAIDYLERDEVTEQRRGERDATYRG